MIALRELFPGQVMHGETVQVYYGHLLEGIYHRHIVLLLLMLLLLLHRGVVRKKKVPAVGRLVRVKFIIGLEIIIC